MLKIHNLNRTNIGDKIQIISKNRSSSIDLSKLGQYILNDVTSFKRKSINLKCCKKDNQLFNKNQMRKLIQMGNLQKCHQKTLQLITHIKSFIEKFKEEIRNQGNKKTQIISRGILQNSRFKQVRFNEMQCLELQLQKLKQLVNFISEKPDIVKEFVLNKVLTIIEKMSLYQIVNKIKVSKQLKENFLKQANYNQIQSNLSKFIKNQEQNTFHLKRSQSLKQIDNKPERSVQQQHLNRLKNEYNQIKQSQEIKFLSFSIKKLKNSFQNNRSSNIQHLNRPNEQSIAKNKFGIKDQTKKKLTLNKSSRFDNAIPRIKNNIIQGISSINLLSSQNMIKSMQNKNSNNLQLLKILPNISRVNKFNISLQRKSSYNQKRSQEKYDKKKENRISQSHKKLDKQKLKLTSRKIKKQNQF